VPPDVAGLHHSDMIERFRDSNHPSRCSRHEPRSHYAGPRDPENLYVRQEARPSHSDGGVVGRVDQERASPLTRCDRLVPITESVPQTSPGARGSEA
jgi:hypothetical protein